MNHFNFTHLYYKLLEPKFHTVRGKTSFKKYTIMETHEIQYRRMPFFYMNLQTKEIREVRDLSLAFMKQDGDYPNHIIKTRGDYIVLINSVSKWNNYTNNSEITVFHLNKRKRIRPENISKKKRSVALF